MRVRVTRSARKHRMSSTHIREALDTAGPAVVVDGDAATYIGTDSRGIEIEIVVIPDDRHPDGVAVIHAMPTEWRKR